MWNSVQLKQFYNENLEFPLTTFGDVRVKAGNESS